MNQVDFTKLLLSNIQWKDPLNQKISLEMLIMHLSSSGSLKCKNPTEKQLQRYLPLNYENINSNAKNFISKEIWCNWYLSQDHLRTVCVQKETFEISLYKSEIVPDIERFLDDRIFYYWGCKNDPYYLTSNIIRSVAEKVKQEIEIYGIDWKLVRIKKLYRLLPKNYGQNEIKLIKYLLRNSKNKLELFTFDNEKTSIETQTDS